MIKTIRQVNTEKDRYGGYSKAPTLSFDEQLDVSADENSVIGVYKRDSRASQRASWNVPMTDREAWDMPKVDASDAVINYSGRNSARITQPIATDFIKDYKEIKKKQASTPKKRNSELMPSIKSKVFLDEKNKALPKEKTEKLSSSSKAMLAVYLAAVIIMSVVVIAMGIAISGANASLQSLESTIQAKQEQVYKNQQELEKLSDETYLTGLAVNSGMEKVKDTVEVSVSETVEPTVYEQRTNWFDSFCDWISGIMGG